jgi:hypothetical protein
MTSKEFFNEVFASCVNTDGVSATFKSLMNEMCEACNERQEELKSGKTKKTAKTSAKATAKAESKVTAKKTTKTEVKKEVAKAKAAKKTAKVEAPEVEVIKINKRTINKLGLQYVDYSEKSFAIIGETKPIKEELKSLKGRFNAHLTVDGEQVAGWVFAKRNIEPVKKSLYIA